MNLVDEISYPNNGKRPLSPSDAIGKQQIAELAAYKLKGGFPRGIDAIANAMELNYGSAWNNSVWLARPGPRKTWQAGGTLTVVVPDRNKDGSYITRPFTAGSGFDFSLWTRAHADFYNSAYGQFFPALPVLKSVAFSGDEARDLNLQPGPALDYPMGIFTSTGGGMNPDYAYRIDEAGDIKIFGMKAFRDANPIVGESSHIIPVGSSAPEGILLSQIAATASNDAMPTAVRLSIIRQMLGVPTPWVSTTNAI